MANYRAGFNECAAEVARYLMSLDNVSDELRAHLLSHLSSYYSSQTQSRKWTGAHTNGIAPVSQMLRLPTRLSPPLVPAFPIPTAKPSDGGFSSTLPSPPSSPQQDNGLMRITGPSQVIFSNGMPAILVPNDGLRFLPLTWQTPTPFGDPLRRPCISW